MRQSLRLPFAFLLLVAAFFVFSLWEFFLGGRPAASMHEDAPIVVMSLPCSPNATLNATLIRMATTEVGEAELRTDIESLLEGRFTSVYEGPFGRRRFWSYSPWRRDNHHKPWRRVRLPAQFRAPKYMDFYPEFRRSLRDWFRKRSLQMEVMSELVRLIKRPIDRHFGRPDSLQRFNSCAVIGNSGILMNNDYGELIDGHNLVIRLNNARVHGYHRNVGSKTGLSFVNSNILHVCARREGCFCHPYGENVPIVTYICQGLHFLDFTICNSSHKAPLLVTDLRFDMLCARIVKYYSLKLFVEETGKPLEEWKKFHDEKLFHYSSGMQAVMLAVGICDQVSIFGFGKSSDAKHHYHTNQKKELDLHDYKAEYALYNDLVEQPQVIIPFLNGHGFQVPPVMFYH
ncbi:sialyltransferase-like protein 1 isoform X1 [Zingiber officinale]|uniref:Sialyltransferase-like protein 1 n=1 Tax=Zingiber officinale TaxID=94328 RepID=A0A8J5LLA1_ZINOF|nr:sialyltransferase-like protein 1 isoform X1 [Zingiber officinale]KAG6529921.1 hypothetical protein ZIOFF_012138 [Zingiber officinale]